ncbi:MAG: prepilin peptidase [Oscillospiraceae bacterium]|nr:prepilin peptidase [Oscillospiraceae bacterium]
MLRMILLIILLGLFGLYDLRYRKVNNRAVRITAVMCFLLSCVMQGVKFALGGMAVGFLLTLLMYVIGAIGAGDVKLFAALGALAGARLIARILVFSILVGGAVGVILIVASLLRKSGIKKALKQSAPFVPQCFLGLVFSMII